MDVQTDDFKQKTTYGSAKEKAFVVSDNGIKSKLFAKFKFGSNKKNEGAVSRSPDSDLHVVWYSAGDHHDKTEDNQLASSEENDNVTFRRLSADSAKHKQCELNQH